MLIKAMLLDCGPKLHVSMNEGHITTVLLEIILTWNSIMNITYNQLLQEIKNSKTNAKTHRI